MSNNVLVVDVESTCWESYNFQPTSEKSEIIEIGVTEVNINKLTIIRNESILIRPQQSKISSFCTQLTSITPKMVENKYLFHEACNILEKDYKSNNKTMVSWGDYDKHMFEKNCSDFNRKYPFGKRHINLKNVFTILYGMNKEPGMESALKQLGIPLEGTHHRGGDDSNNIAKILIHVLKKFRSGQ